VEPFLSHLLGLGVEPKDLTFLQISLRAVIVFFALLAMVRVGAKRFLAKLTALDAIVGFILASMLARAVNGSAAFFPTLAGGFVVVFLHRLLSALAFRFKWLETLIKGNAGTVGEGRRTGSENRETKLYHAARSVRRTPTEWKCGASERSKGRVHRAQRPGERGEIIL
jgi:hypothetical protein